MEQFDKAIVGIIGGTVLFAVAVAMKQIGKMFLSVIDFPKHYIAWTDIKQRMILLMVFVDRQLQKKTVARFDPIADQIHSRLAQCQDQSLW